jgi:hypothetical protein
MGFPALFNVEEKEVEPMRPAFVLYAEYLAGTPVEDLARKHSLRQNTVRMMVGAARMCLERSDSTLWPGEMLRFRPQAA